jgi:hypothetical protein
MEVTTSAGKEHCLVLGRTTKFNHGLIKRTKWVTNDEGHRAITISKSIADFIYGILDVKPAKSTDRINKFPLFVSVAYLPICQTDFVTYDGMYRTGSFHVYYFDKLKKNIFPKIEDGDIRELEQIDPHRAWRSETKFRIGQTWPFKTHQLRRSLALYAHRSGLVSLTSLRRQLKHITEEMTRYYSRGSTYAKNLIGDDNEHFGKEWQETAPMSAALSYFANVIFSDEVLFGGHANWLNNQLREPGSIIKFDRSETIRRFKKGLLVADYNSSSKL